MNSQMNQNPAKKPLKHSLIAKAFSILIACPWVFTPSLTLAQSGALPTTGGSNASPKESKAPDPAASTPATQPEQPDIAGIRQAAKDDNKEAQFALGVLLLKDKRLQTNNETAAFWFKKAAENGHISAAYNLGICYVKGIGGAEQSYANALIWFQKAADQGDPAAQYNLGLMYNDGLGIEKNIKLANNLFSKAVEKNYAPAKYALGLNTSKGDGITQDTAKALELFESAAKDNYDPAFFVLGVTYQNGIGVTKDEKKAFEYFLKSAELGNIDAQLLVADAYKNGKNVPVSMPDYVKWVTRAAETKQEKGVLALAKLYREGDGVPADPARANQILSDAQKNGSVAAMYELGINAEQDQKPDKLKALSWFEKAAAKGYGPAEYKLYQYYKEGFGTATQQANTKDWLKKAFDHNSPEAIIFMGQSYMDGTNGFEADPNKSCALFKKVSDLNLPAGYYYMGVCYRDGQAGEQSYTKAKAYFLLAAQNGNAAAQNELAKLYASGLGVEKDEKEALKWFEKSAEKGLKEAQYQMGLAYRQGRIVSPDEKVATKWFDLASQQNYPSAQYELGMSYLDGKGIEKNEKLAAELFEKAATKGDKDAQYHLAICYRDGVGVKADKLKSYAWFKIASSSGDMEISRARDKEMESLSAQDIQEGNKLADKYKQSVFSVNKNLEMKQ